MDSDQFFNKAIDLLDENFDVDPESWFVVAEPGATLRADFTVDGINYRLEKVDDFVDWD